MDIFLHIVANTLRLLQWKFLSVPAWSKICIHWIEMQACVLTSAIPVLVRYRSLLLFLASKERYHTATFNWNMYVFIFLLTLQCLSRTKVWHHGVFVTSKPDTTVSSYRKVCGRRPHCCIFYWFLYCCIFYWFLIILSLGRHSRPQRYSHVENNLSNSEIFGARILEVFQKKKNKVENLLDCLNEGQNFGSHDFSLLV